MIRKFSAVKRELCDIGFQHSRNLVFPQSIAGLQQDFGVFFAEGFISHLLKNSEHGPVIHVVPVDHGILALCGTIPLKKDASGSAPFYLVGTPQIVFGIVSAALQNRVIHTGAGNRNPAFDVRVFSLQSGKVHKGFRFRLFFPSR